MHKLRMHELSWTITHERKHEANKTLKMFSNLIGQRKILERKWSSHPLHFPAEQIEDYFIQNSTFTFFH